MKSFRPKDDGATPPPAAAGATPSATSTARSGRTRRTPRPPTPTPGSTARAGQGGQAVLHGACADGEPHGLIVDAALTRAGARRAAGGAGHDRAPHDARDFVDGAAHPEGAPARRPPANTSGRRSAIDRRTTRHPGYAASQRIRKRIEEAFGWIKTVAGLLGAGSAARCRSARMATVFVEAALLADMGLRRRRSALVLPAAISSRAGRCSQARAAQCRPSLRLRAALL
jgi:hypothetical protein